MRNIQIFLRFVKAFFRRHGKIILGSILLLLLSAFLIFRVQEFYFKPIVSQGLIGTYTEKDLPPLVTNLLSTGLVQMDDSGLPKPGLAEKWEVSEDGKVYIFTLKKNQKWIDGTDIKASDLRIGIPDVEIKVVDDYSIKFTLADSYSPFPTKLTQPIFKGESFIGTGPYKLIDLKKDNEVFVKKLRLIPTDKSYPDVVIRFYQNEKTAKNALKLGEVKSILGISDTSDFENQPTLSSFEDVNYSQLVTIFYDTKDPILSDDNFRLALSYAAPVIEGEQEAFTSLPPTSWAFNKDVKDYLNNPEAAKASFNRVKNGKDTEIVLTTITPLKNVGEKVVEEWKKLGVKAVLRVESGVPQNFQALLISKPIPTDPDQYTLWHSTQQQTNISHFSNVRIDKDLEDGRKIADLETRKARYQDFQRVLLDHAPATFLYFPKQNVIYYKKIDAPLKKVLDLQFD